MRFFVKPCSFSVGIFTSVRGFILLLYTRTPYTLENCPPPRVVVLLHPTPHTGHVINIYAHSFYLFIFLPIDLIDFVFSLPSLNVQLIYDDVYNTLLGRYLLLCDTVSYSKLIYTSKFDTLTCSGVKVNAHVNDQPNCLSFVIL